MIFRSATVCLILTVSASGANYSEHTIGTIQKPGFDYMIPRFANSAGYEQLVAAVALKGRFDASYVALNEQIPSQVIVVAPHNGSTGVLTINDENVEIAARNFLYSNGILPSDFELRLESVKHVLGKSWFLRFRKFINGLPCEDGGISLALSDPGKVNVIWGNIGMTAIAPGNFLLDESAAYQRAIFGLEGSVTRQEYRGKVILPLYFGDTPEFHFAHKFMVATENPYAEWEVLIDAESGEILQRIDKVYYDIVSGNVSGSIQLMYPFDPWVDRDFFHLDLNFDGYDPVTTDMSGDYSIDIDGSSPLNVYSQLRGPFMQVMNDDGVEAEANDVVDPPTVYNVYWNDTNSTPPERDAWYSGVFVHNWIKTLDPDLAVMDFPMVSNVNVPGSCNAFWSGLSRTINFYRAGGGCSNIAQIADVVFHEYGHGITDLQTRPNGPNGAMHEGFSDYIACTITDQPLVGVGFYIQQPYSPLRSLDNDRRYPDDWSGEPHNDGLIIGGALWHTREDLSDSPMGYTDSLWHYARYALTEEFESYFWAFVALDDDDGDISNGTPNAAVIFENFGDRHGIGPGTTVSIAADTILASEDTTRSFTVSATISSVFELRADSVILYYDNGAGYVPVPMTSGGSTWDGVIPPQSNGTHVNYYILAVDEAGFRGTWPSGAPGNHYGFYVGPDIIPPTLTLIEGPPNTVNLFGPYGTFAITTFDIAGINPNEVRLHYFVNSEAENMASLEPGVNEGEYMLASVDLDRQLETGDSVHYYFTALDEANIPNMGRLPQSGNFSLVMTLTEVFETFESNSLDRWTVDEGWTMRNDGYYSRHSVWFAPPVYPNNANASLTSNFEYDLSPYASALLTFYRKHAIRIGDTCSAEASNDGGATWTRIGAFTDTIMPMIYRYTECDLGPVLNPNAHHYKIRFRFVSDDTMTWAGMFLDNIGWRVDPLVGIDEPISSIPTELALPQNYPNPFNPSTIINFSLPAAGGVRLEIFDLLGRRLAVLVDDRLNAGNYNFVWNGADAVGNQAASGIYFYRLTTEQGISQQKMTLLR